mmetsp:Transcript_4296/g.9225  ORF Transcript_4296/g.9225 Transcript_4296/m.9225 type:complete len:670 (+) Transcript_4296:1232-3241(+)
MCPRPDLSQAGDGEEAEQPEDDQECEAKETEGKGVDNEIGSDQVDLETLPETPEGAAPSRDACASADSSSEDQEADDAAPAEQAADKPSEEWDTPETPTVAEAGLEEAEDGEDNDEQDVNEGEAKASKKKKKKRKEDDGDAEAEASGAESGQEEDKKKKKKKKKKPEEEAVEAEEDVASDAASEGKSKKDKKKKKKSKQVAADPEDDACSNAPSEPTEGGKKKSKKKKKRGEAEEDGSLSSPREEGRGSARSTPRSEHSKSGVPQEDEAPPSDGAISAKEAAGGKLVGRLVETNFGGDWFPGKLESFDSRSLKYHVVYDDGDEASIKFPDPEYPTRLKVGQTPTVSAGCVTAEDAAGGKLEGKSVEVLFADENWYPGQITKYNKKKGLYTVVYDDGDRDELAIPSADFPMKIREEEPGSDESQDEGAKPGEPGRGDDGPEKDDDDEDPASDDESNETPTDASPAPSESGGRGHRASVHFNGDMADVMRHLNMKRNQTAVLGGLVRLKLDCAELERSFAKFGLMSPYAAVWVADSDADLEDVEDPRKSEAMLRVGTTSSHMCSHKKPRWASSPCIDVALPCEKVTVEVMNRCFFKSDTRCGRVDIDISILASSPNTVRCDGTDECKCPQEPFELTKKSRRTGTIFITLHLVGVELSQPPAAGGGIGLGGD